MKIMMVEAVKILSTVKSKFNKGSGIKNHPFFVGMVFKNS
jgi:hypothetical protein